jgi:hypothetical protein
VVVLGYLIAAPSGAFIAWLAAAVVSGRMGIVAGGVRDNRVESWGDDEGAAR